MEAHNILINCGINDVAVMVNAIIVSRPQFTRALNRDDLQSDLHQRVTRLGTSN